jgi:xylulokinase
VAYSLKDSFTIFEEMKIPVTRIRLGGGGARSALWRQIQADVYGHEVEIVEAEEGAAYGAAILAGAGAGAWASVDEACDAVIRVASRVSVSARGAVTMQNGYGIYREIYPALHRVFARESPRVTP